MYFDISNHNIKKTILYYIFNHIHFLKSENENLKWKLKETQDQLNNLNFYGNEYRY